MSKCSHNAMVRQIIDRLHVGDSDDAAIAAMDRAMKPEFRNTAAAAEYRKWAVEHHKCNQRLYSAVMRGL